MFFLSNSCCNKGVSDLFCFQTPSATGVRSPIGHWTHPNTTVSGSRLRLWKHWLQWTTATLDDLQAASWIWAKWLWWQSASCFGLGLSLQTVGATKIWNHTIYYDIIWDIDLHFCVWQLSTFWRPTKSYKLSRSTYTIPQIWLDGVFWQVPRVLGLGYVDRIVRALNSPNRIRHDGSSISHPCLFGAEFLHNTGEDVKDVLFVFVMLNHFLDQRTSITGDLGSG